ncbi:cryptococcal mannosyltransferase 1-domain-containing protein [Sphaerosporella brunnea]|uniref:Cryptococcal mannosyltransferase 1-domain-containing protein n=1 Tax=Sphaerosporella brunnea TaxID=1250544 RepID=A0A5J5EJ02_9PEZI|nr:cryptococcal mannosyltransferase 1-domain-containing protein [Sphaerosporella brunnea]
MPPPENIELLTRSGSSAALPEPDAFALSSSDDDDDDDSDSDSEYSYDSDAEARLLQRRRYAYTKKRPSASTTRTCPWWVHWVSRLASARTKPRSLRRSWPRYIARRSCQLLGFVVYSVLLVVVFNALLRPSYTPVQYPSSWHTLDESVRKGGGTNPPGYWKLLPGEHGVQKATASGRGNPNNERVFIAANIVNAELIEQEWGVRVMELMDMLGPENVFLSIFENDSGLETKKALHSLASRIKAHMPNAGQSIVSTTLPFSGVPRVKIPGGGETYIKRITYLAEVRNRALLPLIGAIPSLARWNQTGHPASKTPTHEDIGDWVSHPSTYTRIVFLNDVVFSPHEVLHLLFSTNGGDYAAACGIDYINPFKYYDTFATRDTDGFPLGIPFFPYFATAGPRDQILATSPEVAVASCWGGVIALNASYFLREKDPIRFRSEKEPYWDASECCLVHADIDEPTKTFINPFVRVAYDRTTFNWLPFVRHIERSFALPHRILAWALGMPWPGLRRLEKQGERIEELQWDGQKWVQVVRTAGKGGYCGSRKLLVMNEHPAPGERRWKNLPVPVPGV